MTDNTQIQQQQVQGLVAAVSGIASNASDLVVTGATMKTSLTGVAYRIGTAITGVSGEMTATGDAITASILNNTNNLITTGTTLSIANSGVASNLVTSGANLTTTIIATGKRLTDGDNILDTIQHDDGDWGTYTDGGYQNISGTVVAGRYFRELPCWSSGVLVTITWPALAGDPWDNGISAEISGVFGRKKRRQTLNYRFPTSHGVPPTSYDITVDREDVVCWNNETNLMSVSGKLSDRLIATGGFLAGDLVIAISGDLIATGAAISGNLIATGAAISGNLIATGAQLQPEVDAANSTVSQFTGGAGYANYSLATNFRLNDYVLQTSLTGIPTGTLKQVSSVCYSPTGCNYLALGQQLGDRVIKKIEFGGTGYGTGVGRDNPHSGDSSPGVIYTPPTNYTNVSGITYVSGHQFALCSEFELSASATGRDAILLFDYIGNESGIYGNPPCPDPCVYVGLSDFTVHRVEHPYDPPLNNAGLKGISYNPEKEVFYGAFGGGECSLDGIEVDAADVYTLTAPGGISYKGIQTKVEGGPCPYVCWEEGDTVTITWAAGAGSPWEGGISAEVWAIIPYDPSTNLCWWYFRWEDPFSDPPTDKNVTISYNAAAKGWKVMEIIRGCSFPSIGVPGSKWEGYETHNTLTYGMRASIVVSRGDGHIPAGIEYFGCPERCWQPHVDGEPYDTVTLTWPSSSPSPFRDGISARVMKVYNTSHGRFGIPTIKCNFEFEWNLSEAPAGPLAHIIITDDDIYTTSVELFSKETVNFSPFPDLEKLSDVYYDPNSNHLFLTDHGEEDYPNADRSSVYECGLTGNLIDYVDLKCNGSLTYGGGGMMEPSRVPNYNQLEGITFSPDGGRMVVAGRAGEGSDLGYYTVSSSATSGAYRNPVIGSSRDDSEVGAVNIGRMHHGTCIIDPGDAIVLPYPGVTGEFDGFQCEVFNTPTAGKFSTFDIKISASVGIGAHGRAAPLQAVGATKSNDWETYLGKWSSDPGTTDGQDMPGSWCKIWCLSGVWFAGGDLHGE